MSGLVPNIVDIQTKLITKDKMNEDLEMKLISKCHCGAVTLIVKDAPSSLMECNCTFCSKHGALWAYYKPTEVTFESVEQSIVICSDPGTPQHHFCSICHCLSHYYQESSWTGDGTPGEPMIGINARLFESFDISKLPLDFVDGLNEW